MTTLVGIYLQDEGLFIVSVAAGVDIYAETEKLAKGNPWMVINAANLPDSYFRKAWAWDGDNTHPVTIDIVRAREVQKEVISLGIPDMRQELNDELNEAIIDGDTEEEMVIRQKLKKLKNILSDIRITECTEAEALKTLTLEYLMDNDALMDK